VIGGYLEVHIMQTGRRTGFLGAILLAAALLGAACDGKDAKTQCDPVSQTTCLDDLGSGVCSDIARAPICVSGQWQCPQGTVAQAECQCLGPPADGGWECRDGAAAP